jgi:hypothetical protein
MRRRVVPLVALTAALASCTRVPGVRAPDDLRIERVHTAATPSPLIQISAGSVSAAVPETWDAAPLPGGRFPQQGFIASPRIPNWERRAGSVNGLEAFWVDEGSVGIPSDYYYLVARGPALPSLGARGCPPGKERVFVDHPPDLTGARFSPSDYVASGDGTCHTRAGRMRWAYVVAAPGFGPLRSVGIPTSGLYVVIAAATGSKSKALVAEMIRGARFGNTSISQIEKAAIQAT